MRKILSIFTALLFAGSMMAADYELVTDVANLSAGDKIIIVNAGGTKAMSTTQNSSNRGAAAVTVNNNKITPSASVQILTLSKSSTYWELYTGSGYLYASSSSSNQLKTRDNNTSNPGYGQWTITITDGVASIVANRTGRSTMQYNSGSDIFACYASASQTNLKIFKENVAPTVTVSPSSWDFGSVGTTDAVSKVFSVSGANLTAGDLTLSVPAGFSVSPSTITLEAAGELAATNVTVSKNATEAGAYAGNLSISGCGLASAVNVALSMELVAPVAVESIELNETSVTLEVAQKQQLEATVKPDEATNKAVTWESSAEAIATVDEDGLVTAVAVGSATITCKSVADNTITATCTITVKAHEVTPGKYSVDLNNSFFGCTVGNNTVEQTSSQNDITFVAGCTEGALNATNYQADHIRFYTDSYLNISVPKGFEITEIELIAYDSKWDGEITSNPTGYDSDNKTWSGKAQEVDFSFGKQNRIESVSVTYQKETDPTPTAIDNADATVKAVKFVENGQLFIEKNGHVYNVQGQTIR